MKIVREPLAVLDMWWCDVAFVSWRFDPSALQATLPAGLAIDTFEGSAWLSVVPFHLRAIRPFVVPAFAGIRHVAEINLRTYVRSGDERGIFFFSLDARGALVVAGARVATGLPYFRADIESDERDGTIAYRSARRDRSVVPGAFAARYVPAAATRRAAPQSLDAFLHERYAFFVERGGRLLRSRVKHEPWPISDATIEIEHNSLGDLIGTDLARPPDACTFSRGVRVAALMAERVASSRQGRPPLQP